MEEWVDKDSWRILCKSLATGVETIEGRRRNHTLPVHGGLDLLAEEDFL